MKLLTRKKTFGREWLLNDNSVAEYTIDTSLSAKLLHYHIFKGKISLVLITAVYYAPASIRTLTNALYKQSPLEDENAA